jgi:energy-coupling factor transporter ATP-binding protein EcfA2
MASGDTTPANPNPLNGQATETQAIKGFDLTAYIARAQEQFYTDPNTFLLPAAAGVAGTLVAAMLTIALVQFWKQASLRVWRMLAWLGSKPGFSWLALNAYRRAVEARYGQLHNIYLGNEEILSLRDVFVPLTLHGKTASFTENQNTRQILTDPKQKRLVLLGAPGSGKSTLLKAWASGISRRESTELRELIPVFVSLRSFAQAEPEQSLFDWLVNKELPGLRLRNPRNLLQNLLAQGRVLLLLDGLDEVAHNRLDTINRAISALLAADVKHQCRVWLTCREQNYADLPDRDHYRLEGFEEYRVAELRDSQIREIVRRRESDFQGQDKIPAHYLEQVFQRSDILQLHRNPLLLTLSMGVYLHQPSNDIPHKLAEFYQQAIDNLLLRHHFQKTQDKPANLFDKDDKLHLLQEFALENLLQATDEGRDFETFPFNAIVTTGEALAKQGVVNFKPEQARDAAWEIKERAGLFSATEDGHEYVFAHRSLNEYCAAAALHKHPNGFATIIKQKDNPLWWQVLVFYASIDHPNAVHLVETLRDDSTRQQDLNLLALTGHCAAVLAQPRPQLRLDILQALRTALLSTFNTADTASHRALLLKSLLTLGNSRNADIQHTLDEALREFVALADPSEVAQEIGRVEPAVALQFLGYLADSPEPTHKLAALQGLRQIEGQDKIPVLWRLLHQLPSYEHEAISQLLALMGENGAVELLNVCEPITPPVDAKLRQSIAKAYPFLSEKQTVTPFAWLLGFAVSIGFVPDAIKPDVDNNTWRQFLGFILGEKNANELREWLKLPHDKDKWRPKLNNTMRIGRMMFGLPLFISFALGLAWLLNTVPQASINDIFIIIAVYTFMLTSISWIVLLVWLFWRSYLKARNLLGNLDTYPANFRSWLEPYQGEGPIWRRTVGWCSIVLRRGAVFSCSIFLFSVALFLHNPPSLARHPGNPDEVIRALATNNQGNWLLSGWGNGATLWDIATGIELQRLYNNHPYIDAAAFAPEGKTILTGSIDGTASLWDAITGKELLQMKHRDSVNAVAFSPDGKTVVTGSKDKTARLWDAVTGSKLMRLPHEDNVLAVAFSPDGKTILTGSKDKTARLWDVVTGKLLLTLQHKDSVNAVAFSVDGKTLLTGSVDGVRLWDASTGKEMPRRYNDNADSAYTIAFSPDHKTMLTQSDYVVRVWDVATGTKVQQLLHEKFVYAAIFSSDGNSIYTAGQEGIIRAWDTKTGRLLWQTQRPFWDASTWHSWSILYMWLALVFIVYFLPALKIFDRGQVWYPLGKPNRYRGLYDLPGVERWLPPQ